MNIALCNIIRRIVSEQGESILADPQRLKGWISDYAKDEPKLERLAFGRCIEYGAYTELKNVPPGSRATVKSQLVQKLHNEQGFDTALCAGALDLLEVALWGIPEQKVLCRNCGKELQAEWKVCPYCGTQCAGLVAAVTSVATPATAVPVQSASPEKGGLLMSFAGPGSPVVFSVAYSPDGRRIVSGSVDNTVRIWDVESGWEIRTLKGHDDAISSVAWSPDGRRIASGSRDNTIKVWDAENGWELRTLRHNDLVTSVAYSPDGRRIVSGSWGWWIATRSIMIWDAESGQEISTFKGLAVICVAYNPDGRRIVSGSLGWNAILKVWDAENERELRTLKGHNDLITSVAYSPDGRRIVSGSTDNTIKVWDAESGREIRTLAEHNDAVSSVAYSPDGRRIVSGSKDTTLKIWDTESWQKIKTFSGHRNNVTSLAYSPDGRRIASGADDGLINIWNVEE